MPELCNNLKSIPIQKMPKLQHIQTIQPLHKQWQWGFRLVCVGLFLWSCLVTGYSKETTAIFPGNSERICSYSDFCYYFPQEDFVYHLNDRLLFMEKPDGQIVESGIRKKLLTVIQQYREIKKSLSQTKRNGTGGFTLDMTLPGGFTGAEQILAPLGLSLVKQPGNHYRISRTSQFAYNEYYSFARLEGQLNQWQQSLNQNRTMDILVTESEVSVPWDYDFLQEITALPVDRESFFETMLGNEQFSLLLATLYRLSPDMIDYISNLHPKTKLGAWKEIYQNPRFLMGLFILSHALRIDYSQAATKNGKLKLPGGTGAKEFWSSLAGVNSDTAPMEFLYRLAVLDDGRLNYLFLFSSFLAPNVQAALFTGANSIEMKQLYPLISLSGREKLDPKKFPNFQNVNFFTLLYTLRMKNNRFYFPLGAPCWQQAIRGEKCASPSSLSTDTSDKDVFLLFKSLLRAPRSGLANRIPNSGRMELFIVLYSKFSGRPQLLSPEVLFSLCRHYEKYNVLVDFIEKIPLRSPETVLKLINKLKAFNNLEGKAREMALAIFQALLEILAHTAKYAPQLYDYDDLVLKLTRIPFGIPPYYNELFTFFQKGLALDYPVQKDLVDIVLAGVKNQDVSIEGSKYLFLIGDVYRKMLTDTMGTQDVATFSSFIEFNHVLNRLEEEGRKSVAERSADVDNELLNRLQQLCDMLPYAEIGSNAPNIIKERVMHYNREQFVRDVKVLFDAVTKRDSLEKLKISIAKIKEAYLLPNLKDYLMAFVYALNAKHPDLRVFLNPNLVRLHDFGEGSAHAWNQCGIPTSSHPFSDYIFSGGLSRLNMTFASKWRKYMFTQTFIYNGHQLDAMLVNLLDIYPLAATIDEASIAGIGTLVEQGENIMQRARADETQRQSVRDALGSVTAGFHYRKSLQYLDRQSNEYALFTAELKHLGELFSLANPPNLGRTGGIYYHTFGNVVPIDCPIFPQSLACFFQEGWLSGEIVAEHLLHMSYLFFKKKIPAVLIGQVLYSHFNQTAPVLFNQNHPADYDTAYFLFQLINDSRLKGLLKYLQKEGYLKLK